MVWPLEPEGVRHFAEGLEEILVVEEKRQLLEYQLKEELYNWREDVRPRVVGKFDEIGEWSEGNWLLPATGELPVATIARVIAERIGRFFTSPTIESRLKLIAAKQQAANTPVVLAERKPHFCSGCPHNTSTRVPEGSRAVAGIGCHYMVTWMDRQTSTFTHMGGEGVPWVGQAPFTEEKHIFANLGDGTYFHSGLLAIRQAIAAKVPITYKILYNDAVAMTGGQPVDGILSVARITRQLEAEGVGKMVIVTNEPEKYAEITDLAPNVPIRHRDELDIVQRELREEPGVSRPDLRPGLRHRSAPAQEARQDAGRHQTRRHQRTRLRRLRRLLGAVQLPVGGAGRDRLRHQAADRPVGLQPGFLLPERLLPQLRHRRRRHAEKGSAVPKGTSLRARSTAKTGRFCPPPPCLPPPIPTTC